MPVFGATKFVRFFRTAAELDVDKNDVKRFRDVVHRRLYDMILVGEITAEANGRDLIFPQDLPITKGLQENLRAFHGLAEEIELAPILEQLAAYPPTDRVLTDEAERRLPVVAGGIALTVARSFRIIDPHLRHPQTDDWDRLDRLLDLLW
jgi:hypothetical protein